MGIGTSLFLIAVGAILYFAVDATVSGIEITTVGIILMVISMVGLLISLFMIGSAGGTPARPWSGTATSTDHAVAVGLLSRLASRTNANTSSRATVKGGLPCSRARSSSAWVR